MLIAVEEAAACVTQVQARNVGNQVIYELLRGVVPVVAFAARQEERWINVPSIFAAELESVASARSTQVVEDLIGVLRLVLRISGSVLEQSNIQQGNDRDVLKSGLVDVVQEVPAIR